MSDEPWMAPPPGQLDTGGTAAQIVRMLQYAGEFRAAELVRAGFVKERISTAGHIYVGDEVIQYASNPQQLVDEINNRTERMAEQALLELPRVGGSLTNLHGVMLRGRDYNRYADKYEIVFYADKRTDDARLWREQQAEKRGLPEGAIEGELID